MNLNPGDKVVVYKDSPMFPDGRLFEGTIVNAPFIMSPLGPVIQVRRQFDGQVFLVKETQLQTNNNVSIVENSLTYHIGQYGPTDKLRKEAMTSDLANEQYALRLKLEKEFL